jgi:hypothetical protein
MPLSLRIASRSWCCVDRLNSPPQNGHSQPQKNSDFAPHLPCKLGLVIGGKIEPGG